jgi:hypothetical protein
MAGYLFGLMALAAVAAYFMATARARSARDASAEKSHSRPVYHGLNAAIWTGVPAFIFLLIWLLARNSVIDLLVLANFPFSDEFWWLKPEQQTDDKKKKDKLKKEIFGKEVGGSRGRPFGLQSVQALLMRGLTRWLPRCPRPVGSSAFEAVRPKLGIPVCATKRQGWRTMPTAMCTEL